MTTRLTKADFRNMSADRVLRWFFQTHRPGVTGWPMMEAYDSWYWCRVLSECHAQPLATHFQNVRLVVKNFAACFWTSCRSIDPPRHHRPFDGRGSGHCDCNAQPFLFLCPCLLFAPIMNPSQSMGRKPISRLPGEDESTWVSNTTRPF